jgi:2-C-methyl-D-erythritol 4-phosphate cytidylyltransferase/2-C-methyl-D-erythritol 2,4-cyclodiphosphate synthase
LGGRTLIEWSVGLLLDSGCAPVVIVVPQDELNSVQSTLGDSRDVVIVSGGPTRQASVRNGLESVTSERVVVHDAVRPLATPQMVRGVLDALEGAEGATVAVPVDETIKRVDGKIVVETLDRSGLWRVQTPQAFHTATLRRAHDEALAAGIEATDDAALVENLGVKVAIVSGSRGNIKLTYPEDFALAEAIVRG